MKQKIPRSSEKKTISGNTGCVSVVMQLHAHQNKKFAWCKIFLEGTLMWTLP